ncbi:DinB family protein [Mesobacillus maritimus]|uniref:DinB family protein n=1 Tax=Mesobacillus maritimus TaxID=1643336 RepID=UPI00384DA570
MGDILKMQFEVIRERIVQKLADLPFEVVDQQPEGFNNNIHWNLGHLLWITEKFLFKENGQLPANYEEYFGAGTKPADWQGNVPTMDELFESSKEQLNRIWEIPTERFLEKLPEPIIGRHTTGELAGFLVFHEAYHFGQMMAMKRIVT